jgi:hypothetical protein
MIENKNVDFFNSKTGNYLILTSYGKVILAKVDNVIVDSAWECYPTAPVFHCSDCIVTVQGNLTKQFDVDKALKTLGFTKAYSDTQAALQNVEEEVNQLERYRDCLKEEINRLIAWYKEVTEFDEKSYNALCRLEGKRPHFPQWEES